MTNSSITPQRLINARNSDSVLIADFLKCSSRFSNETVWIFEGKDVKYFGQRIEIITGKKCSAVVYAGGKKKVLKLFEYVQNHPDIRLRSQAFCVDRDFDRVHPVHSDLYVTPVYSVENFYATESFICRFLRGQFDLNDHNSNEIIEAICKRFRAWRTKFLKSMLDFNAWIAIQKKDPSYSLNLNDLKIEEFVSMKWTHSKFEISKKYNLRKLVQAFPLLPKLARADLDVEISSSFSGDLGAAIRGKFLVDFMYEVVTKLISDAKQKVPLFFDRKRVVTFNLSKSNFISDLSAYADTPDCFREFAKAH